MTNGKSWLAKNIKILTPIIVAVIGVAGAIIAAIVGKMPLFSNSPDQKNIDIQFTYPDFACNTVTNWGNLKVWVAKEKDGKSFYTVSGKILNTPANYKMITCMDSLDKLTSDDEVCQSKQINWISISRNGEFSVDYQALDRDKNLLLSFIVVDKQNDPRKGCLVTVGKEGDVDQTPISSTAHHGGSSKPAHTSNAGQTSTPTPSSAPGAAIQPTHTPAAGPSPAPTPSTTPKTTPTPKPPQKSGSFGLQQKQFDGIKKMLKQQGLISTPTPKP